MKTENIIDRFLARLTEMNTVSRMITVTALLLGAALVGTLTALTFMALLWIIAG